tara:strand:- start:678 stop:821 length:144 start_codon:yes stop_codon:yes gene_type:complete
MNKILIYLNTSVLTGVWTNAYLSYTNMNKQDDLRNNIKEILKELKSN